MTALARAALADLAPDDLDALDGAVLDRMTELLATRMQARLKRSPADADEPLLTVAQAAGRAAVHPETIRRRVRSGELRVAGRVGRELRIAPADLAAWLAWGEPFSTLTPAPRRPRARRPRAARRPLADALASLDQGTG